MKTITLTQGKIALVDDEDYEGLICFNWYAYKKKNQRNWYAYRNTLSGETNKRTVISMHRQILGLTNSHTFLDHRDLNGLNNQKSNLRIATCSQNGANRQVSKNKLFKYKGVGMVNGKQWTASICKDRQSRYLGCFKTQEEAALAYNKAAIELYGQFAHLNKISA